MGDSQESPLSNSSDIPEDNFPLAGPNLITLREWLQSNKDASVILWVIDMHKAREGKVIPSDYTYQLILNDKEEVSYQAIENKVPIIRPIPQGINSIRFRLDRKSQEMIQAFQALREETIANLQQKARVRMSPYQLSEQPESIENQINMLNISAKAKAALKEMISEENYQEALETAREIHPKVKIKTREEIFQALINLGSRMLEEMSDFGRPRVLIIPNNSLEKKFKEIDKHRHYPRQTKAHLARDIRSPFPKVDTPKTTTIVVVDTQPEMPQLPPLILKKSWGERYEWLEAKYQEETRAAKEKGDLEYNIRLINVHEYVVAMQGSLRAYKKTNDEAQIMDTINVSSFSKEYLASSPAIAYGHFINVKGYHGVVLAAYSYFYSFNDSFRGRPIVEVLKY